jgi:DNA helicase IV
MAKYVNLSLNNIDPALYTATTFHSLIQKMLGLNNLYYKNIVEIGSLFKKSNFSVIDTFDYIIVDEAQDLMNITVVEVLDKLIIGGFKNGTWILLLDQNQNIFTNDEEYNFALDYINETFFPAHYLLNCNCRNTEQIARSTSVISLVPPAKYLKLLGPKVKIIKYCNSNELITILRKELISLFAGGTTPADVVVLSRLKYNHSDIFNLKSLNNFDIIENNDINKFNKNEINYFTVQSFKGLESNIVFYIDIGGFRNEQDRFLNYVAMSRAKIMLYIFYSETIKKEYEEVTAEGLELL